MGRVFDRGGLSCLHVSPFAIFSLRPAARREQLFLGRTSDLLYRYVCV